LFNAFNKHAGLRLTGKRRVERANMQARRIVEALSRALHEKDGSESTCTYEFILGKLKVPLSRPSFFLPLQDLKSSPRPRPPIASHALSFSRYLYDLECVEAHETRKDCVPSDKIEEENEDTKRHEGKVEQLNDGEQREEGYGKKGKGIEDIVPPEKEHYIRQRSPRICQKESRKESW